MIKSHIHICQYISRRIVADSSVCREIMEKEISRTAFAPEISKISSFFSLVATMEHHSFSFPFHFTLLFSSLFLSQGYKIDEKTSLIPNVSFNEVTISWRLLVFKIMRRISSNEMSQEFLIFSYPLLALPPPRSHKICL